MTGKKIFIILGIFSINFWTAALSAQTNDNNAELEGDCGRCCGCQLGSAGFTTMNPDNWYDIVTSSYPTFTPLSLNRNVGSGQGDISFTPTGIKVGCKGNYWVNFSAVLLRNEVDTPLIVVQLAANGIFNPNKPLVGTVITPQNGVIATVSTSGLLENVSAGTLFSIIASNGGSPTPEGIRVIAWGISLFRI